jgi:hypothetical protein
MYSAEQRAAMEAWVASGAKGKPPAVFDQRAAGESDWLFIPGCSGGALNGPGHCYCDRVDDQVAELRRELEAWRNMPEVRPRRGPMMQALHAVVRKHGLWKLVNRYARMLERRDALRRAELHDRWKLTQVEPRDGW